ncbi:NAD(P)H dehydrogenase [Prosthecomicrobium hirschii]|uniref:NAD(P)H dehydrogenase n=1 Tax=Prosthecodimorpha hirschii TaxID=665126 RepID=A0A0P6VS44_9HYPH|nr:NAD(P)H-dependent oxidoreductase [Prosthecomicrobium hirschii]KPL54590.1 NAD(P)H dehydrogenase [Prosthecomicrobium hirschii]
MRVLLVLAHPLADSYAAAVAQTARAALEAGGHSVDWLDLYAEDFDPRLTAAERTGYFAEPYDTAAVAGDVARLQAAEALVLVFPQWWFNMPAILKGWFDRVFAPGVAFAHDRAGGRIVPRLENIRHLVVLTTTGSPWWIVKLWMGDPVRRLLKRGIGAFCARGLKFRMLALHDMDRVTPDRLARHLARVERAMARL